jgi:hypothetical protein
MPREPIRRFDESPILTADPSGWWVDNGTLRYQDQETFDCVDLTMMNLLELRRFQHEMPQDKGRGYYPAVGYSAVGWGMAEGCEPRVARIIPEGNDTPCKYDFRPWTKSWPWDPVHPW